MTHRFGFSHNGTDYEVLGTYGSGKNFIVTAFPPGAKRMLGTTGTPSGAKVLAIVSDVSTQAELLAELQHKFHGLVAFTQL